MDDTFDIPVTYKGQDLNIKAQLIKIGFIHKIQVEVNGHIIMLEPDEERNYRAVLEPASDTGKTIDVDLLKAIVTVIQSVP